MGGIVHADGSGILADIILCIACNEVGNDLGIHVGAREKYPRAQTPFNAALKGVTEIATNTVTMVNKNRPKENHVV